MSEQSCDVIIIGGGPAGASAAIFTARAGLSTVVIDADKGVTRRALLNNHYGAAAGTTGPDMVDQGRALAEQAGALWLQASAETVEGAAGAFTVRTDNSDGAGDVVRAASVILATGFATNLAEPTGLATTAGTEPRVSTILAVDAQGHTSTAGIWAAGTVAGTSVHTIITAGDGARVAVNLVSELRGERHVDHDMLPAR